MDRDEWTVRARACLQPVLTLHASHHSQLFSLEVTSQVLLPVFRPGPAQETLAFLDLSPGSVSSCSSFPLSSASATSAGQLWEGLCHPYQSSLPGIPTPALQSSSLDFPGAGSGEIVRWLRALATLAKDLELVPSTHMTAYPHL